MSLPIPQVISGDRAHLAPMLGATDIPFRRICRRFKAGLLSTEMVSAAGVVAGHSAAFKHAVFDTDERPVSLQVVSATPEAAAQAVTELLPLRPDVFELNCGCPDEAICGAGAGASLLDDVPRMQAVLAAMVAVSPIPVSAKIRTGGRKAGPGVAVFARAVEDAGAAFLTVHARARGTQYDESADWSQIAAAVDAVAIPVVGNGDVLSSADAQRMLHSTGCSAVMIGRGSLGAPWVFRDVAEGRNCGILDGAPSGGELLALIEDHLRLITGEYGPVLSVPRIRKHMLWYGRYFEHADRLRTEVFASDDVAAVTAAAIRFFSADERRLDPDSREFRERDALFRRRVLYWAQ